MIIKNKEFNPLKIRTLEIIKLNKIQIKMLFIFTMKIYKKVKDKIKLKIIIR